MDKWQGTGQSIEEAIEKGLKELKISKDEAEIKVIQEPSKGFFGFGKKMAEVEIKKIQEEDLLGSLKMSLNDSIQEKKESDRPIRREKSFHEADCRKAEITDESIAIAVKFVEEVSRQMGAVVTIQAEKRDEEIFISIEGDTQGILIGKHGRTLDALQYLTGLAVHKAVEGRIRVVVDVEGYRERRKATLENLATRYANQAVERGSKVVLEPMNPQERRLIHVALQEVDRVYTESEGEEPFRKLVIIPKNLSNDFVIYVEKFQRRFNDRPQGGDRPRRR